jgi:L-threonylcarbamoyladenylate synthase
MNTSDRTSEIEHAARLLREGKLVAFPTETVYGLGADATNSAAIRRVFEVKGRPATNPLIVHMPSYEEALRYINFSRAGNPKLLRRRLDALAPLWPGPLSVVVPRVSEICSESCAGGDTVALRVPRHEVALRLLSACQKPIAAPSANPSMYVSPTTARHVRDNLANAIDYILDGGPCEVGLESTVVSLLEETPCILRPGAITAQMLQQALGCPVKDFTPTPQVSAEPLLSPGMLEKHYAPRTAVVLRDNIHNLPHLPQRVGAIRFSNAPDSIGAVETRVLSASGDLSEIAANLFATLRDFDQLNLDLIVVDACEPLGLGAAIMDRLLRASKR